MNKVVALCLLGIFSVTGYLSASDYIPGRSYYGRNNYIEYMAGNVPIIITVPHGGNLTPSEIGDRTWGTTVTDRNTDQLAYTFRREFYNMTGRYPHLILCHLKRTKLDVNREITEAAQTNQWAEIAWRQWHEFEKIAADLAILQAGAGVCIDLHGHGHSIQRLELGYSLNDSILQLNDSGIDNYKDSSSIRTLAYTTGADYAELLRGQTSFGGLMQARGIPSIPSPQYPDAADQPYFSGGYNTRQHCSQHGGMISGFQLECNYSGVRDTEANRIRMAQAMSQSLIIYLAVHFCIDIYNLPMSALTVVYDNWLNDTHQQRLTGELIGHWSFDDGTAADSSRFNRHGRLVPGDSNTGVNIVYDQQRNSFVLDLNNPPGHTVNSVVECQGSPPADAWQDIKQSITIAAWVKVDTYNTDNQYMLTWGNSFQITRNGTTDGTRTYMDGLSSKSLTATRSINDSQWHHIAVTYDSDEAVRRIYVNGQQESSDRQSQPLMDSSDSFVIGGRLTGYYNRGWDGRIDDIRLYSYALKPDEIMSVYENLPLPSPQPELQCYDIQQGDLNQDCKTNYHDFSIIASDWLNDPEL